MRDRTTRVSVTKIQCITPDIAIDSNTDCSSCSSEEIDYAQEFKDFSMKLTNNNTKGWMSTHILRILIEKQNQIKESFSLSSYFGGLEIN